MIVMVVFPDTFKSCGGGNGSMHSTPDLSAGLTPAPPTKPATKRA
jgi:hypothetical protein